MNASRIIERSVMKPIDQKFVFRSFAYRRTAALFFIHATNTLTNHLAPTSLSRAKAQGWEKDRSIIHGVVLDSIDGGTYGRRMREAPLLERMRQFKHILGDRTSPPPEERKRLHSQLY